ncbi:MAG: nicotinate (nicotinamide) nucleotide adenylyltransferase [Chloroflexi bacterium]|nr:nicotinate (nicotinamide) nucleotide adenylyltransferase [Chloroflexota bacterium]
MGLKKIGIFGGSFDPVHNGHIEIGLLAIEQLDLDILLYVPVFDQWMKKSGPYAKPKDRMEMLEVATEKYSNLLVSDLDIKRNKRTYTIDTLKEVIAENSSISEIFLIMGEDSLITFGSWHKSEEIKKICRIAMYRRNEEKNLIGKQNSIKILEIKGPSIEISSTMIRRNISLGKKISEFVNPKVINIIKKKGLYNSND